MQATIPAGLDRKEAEVYLRLDPKRLTAIVLIPLVLLLRARSRLLTRCTIECRPRLPRSPFLDNFRFADDSEVDGDKRVSQD